MATANGDGERRRHAPRLDLKAEIIRSPLKTQRRAALVAEMPETRLSDIIRGRGPQITKDEKRRIARAVGMPIARLFGDALASITRFRTPVTEDTMNAGITAPNTVVPQPTVDASTVERVLLDGDLAKLTPAQRVSYYTKVCDSVGLNPLTRPFEYITLNGKLTLYARREASEQLRKRNKVSITITARELLEGEVYVVTARATLPDGRTDESIGVKSLKGLVGESRANAMMTAETKSKRRVTLSICGLGLLDETEIADIPDVAKPALSGYATLPAPPPEAAADEKLPAVGFLLISRIDTHPTKTPNLNRFRISFSDGRVMATINPMLASLAESFCRDRVPCKPTSKDTKWGFELLKLERENPDEPELPMQEPLTADDIPF